MSIISIYIMKLVQFSCYSTLRLLPSFETVIKEICFEVEMKNSNSQFSKSKKLEFSDSEEDMESSLSSSSSEDVSNH